MSTLRFLNQNLISLYKFLIELFEKKKKDGLEDNYVLR